MMFYDVVGFGWVCTVKLVQIKFTSFKQQCVHPDIMSLGYRSTQKFVVSPTCSSKHLQCGLKRFLTELKVTSADELLGFDNMGCDSPTMTARLIVT